MDTLIAVYVENIETGGQTGFEFFKEDEQAVKHMQKVKEDIKKYGKQSKFKVVKRIVDYDKYNNRVSL